MKLNEICFVKKRRQPIILNNVLIEDFAAEGKSLAKIDGKVIFIERTVPGDIVDIQLAKSKKDWAEAYPIAFKQLSAIRTTPFCEHFQACGGCQWQMLPYAEQLKYKHKQVLDNLTRIGKVALPEMLPIVGANKTEYYRNKVEYTFATKKFVPSEEFKALKDAGLPIVTEGSFGGFHAKGMFDKVVEINKCHLQAEPTNQIRNAIAQFCIENKYPFYDIKNHTGWLRNMMVRIATTGEWMVNIMLGYENEKMRTHLLDFVLAKFPNITSLIYTINTKLNDSIYDLEPIAYSGKGYIIEKLENYQFIIGPKSFFQTNTKQGEQLYNITKNFAELTGTQTVYDLYCGTGSIGIFVSSLLKKLLVLKPYRSH
jgi:23S rRNA (uracil1939-C5)-methyltransferase